MPFAHAQGEIQPAKAGIANFEVLDDAQRVQIVVEAQAKLAHGLIQRSLAGMAKGRVPNVMHQRQRFGHVFVQLERIGDGARDLRHFHGVGEPAAKVIGVAVGKDLRFSRQAAEGAGMDHPRAVTLKGSSIRMGCFGMLALRQQVTRIVGNSTPWWQREAFSATLPAVSIYCFGLAPADSSLASFTRALSSFFCTLLTSPGSASAGAVRAYSCRLCSHCAAANFSRPVFS